MAILNVISEEVINVANVEVTVSVSETATEANTNVLWFSRHDMSKEQLQALVNKLGDIRITKINGTIPNAFCIKEYVDAADVVAIVAPINMQQQFLKIAGNKPVISAISDRILVPDENGGENKVVFQFDHWDLIEKIEVVTSEFCR